MNELENALLAECRLITENTLWNPSNPRGIDDVHDSEEREALALRYFAACKSGLEFIRAEETGQESGRRKTPDRREAKIPTSVSAPTKPL